MSAPKPPAPEALQVADAMLRRLKLKPLLIFDRVVQRQSILHAARELNLTQSAVTKAVRELEDDLGVQLFERSNRGVTPTAYGRRLESRVKAVIGEVRLLTDELNRFQKAQTGHVVVGTLIAGSARLLPLAISALKAQSPDVLITVREGSSDRLYPALAAGELDVIVGRLPEPDHPITQVHDVQHETLVAESMHVVVRQGHPLIQSDATRRRAQANATLTLAETMACLWILPPPESPIRRVAERLFSQAQLPLPSRRVESLSLLTNVGLMLHADACGLMPTGVMGLFTATHQLQSLGVEGLAPFGDVGFSLRANKPLTPATTEFVACLRRVATA